MELVQEWREHFEVVNAIAGLFACRKGGDSKSIEKIVQIILKKLGSQVQKEDCLGADVFSDTEVQSSFLDCLKAVAIGNNYNDLYSLTLKGSNIIEGTSSKLSRAMHLEYDALAKMIRLRFLKFNMEVHLHSSDLQFYFEDLTYIKWDGCCPVKDLRLYVRELPDPVVVRSSGESRPIEKIVRLIYKRPGGSFPKVESIVHYPPQGAVVFSNTEVQQFFLNCLKEVAMCNNYNDLCSLILKISRRRRKITNWEKGDLIGRGSFGSVYKGFNEDGLFFAVKEVSLNDEKRLGCLENEIALLKKLDHENIVQYYGTEKDEEKLYIFLELVSHGTIEQAYKSCPFKEYQVSEYTGQMLQGLKYLHNCNVIHRDLKCANMLVNESGRIKLADFGLSRFMEDSVPLKPGSRSSFWMAPEVANPKSGGYDFQADIWSLGCTVLEMSTGKYPQYDFKNAWDLELAIRKGRGPVIPDSLSHHLKDFLNKCLQPDPNERPTAAELLAHPFVSESSCRQPDPIKLLSGEHASIIMPKLTDDVPELTDDELTDDLPELTDDQR